MHVPYGGKNIYKTFLKAGKIISAKIARREGVIGILGTGSIGRKYGDEESDLDLLVYAESQHVRELAKLVSHGWTAYKGMEFDIIVLDYNRALKARVPSIFWTQIKRWDHQNSQILYDSRGRLKDLIKKKVVYPDCEQKQFMEKYKIRVHEHLVFFPDLWASRGNLYNVIDTLHRAVQYLLLWIYAKNKLFEPFADKWLFYHLEMRAIPEHKYLKILTEIYTTPIRTLKNAMGIRKKLLNLCDDLELKFEVYSPGEAHERARKNWKKLPDASKEVLSW